jgi:peroxiredoxin Q/BCP
MAVSPGRFSAKPVVVFFCPSLGNPNCVAPLQSLRDGWLGLRSKLGMVIAVLTDDRIHLREHAYAQELPFLLTTDADGAVARAYGVGIAASAPAQLFLLSPEMKITHRVTDPGPAIASDLLKDLPP